MGESLEPLGEVQLAQGTGASGAAASQLLADAVASCRRALEVVTREGQAPVWALTQSGLGLALAEQGLRLPEPDGEGCGGGAGRFA